MGETCLKLWGSLLPCSDGNLDGRIQHPFAVGATLAEFTAVSTDDTWQPVFIQSMMGAVRKLATLNSLAVYFNTDSQSITESP